MQCHSILPPDTQKSPSRLSTSYLLTIYGQFQAASLLSRVGGGGVGGVGGLILIKLKAKLSSTGTVLANWNWAWQLIFLIDIPIWILTWIQTFNNLIWAIFLWENDRLNGNNPLVSEEICLNTMVHNILGCVLILRNQLLPNSGPPPPSLRNQDNHHPDPPTPL